MKLTIPQDRLKLATKAASAFAASRTTFPVLTHLLIEADPDGLRITASDLDMFFVHRVGAEVETPGAIALPAAQLSAVAAALPAGDVTVSVSGTVATVTSGRSRHKIPGLDPGEFPSVPAASDPITTLSIEQVQQLAGLHAFASGEETRPILNGVLVESIDGRLRATATNGHRLVRRDLGEGTLGRSIIIGNLKRAAGLFTGPVTVSGSDNNIRFADDDTEVTTRLIEGPYPATQPLFDAAVKGAVRSFRADRKALREAVSRVALATRNMIQPQIALSLNGNVGISASGEEGRSAEEPFDAVEVQGDPMVIGLNPEYVTELLGYMDSDIVEWRLSAPERACLLTPEGADSPMILLMPLRLNT